MGPLSRIFCLSGLLFIMKSCKNTQTYTYSDYDTITRLTFITWADKNYYRTYSHISRSRV